MTKYLNLSSTCVLLASLLFFGFSRHDGVAVACSTATSPSQSLLGKNFDWHDQVVMAVRQESGIQRQSLDLNRTARPLTWLVNYGSLTLSQFGPGLPFEGMNDQGLVIQILWLDGSQYEPKQQGDHRPAVNELEWIQYHLDNYKSVSEILSDADVVESSADVNRSIYRQKKIWLDKVFADVHYLVCDTQKLCATFEWLGGQLVVHQLSASDAQVLTNSTYEESLARFEEAAGMPAGTSSSYRFTRLAHARTRQDPADVDSMFELLDQAQQSSTVWQSVYDQSLGKVVVKHRASASTAKLGFGTSPARSCTLPAMQWLAYRPHAGALWLAEDEFAEYSLNQHRAALKSGLEGLNLEAIYPLATMLDLVKSSYPCQ